MTPNRHFDYSSKNITLYFTCSQKMNLLSSRNIFLLLLFIDATAFICKGQQMKCQDIIAMLDVIKANHVSDQASNQLNNGALLSECFSRLDPYGILFSQKQIEHIQGQVRDKNIAISITMPYHWQPNRLP